MMRSSVKRINPLVVSLIDLVKDRMTGAGEVVSTTRGPWTSRSVQKSILDKRLFSLACALTRR